MLFCDKENFLKKKSVFNENTDQFFRVKKKKSYLYLIEIQISFDV